MLITEVHAEETQETAFAGRFTVTFTQIFVASVAVSVTASTLPQITAQTNVGNVQPENLPENIAIPFSVASNIAELQAMTTPIISYSGVQQLLNSGAGLFSSVPNYAGKLPF
jgi:hypothetical protein